MSMLSASLHEAIESFLLAGDQRGLSGGSLYLHRHYLENLGTWLSEKGVITLDDLSRDILRRWAVEIKANWKPATVHNAVRSVRQWLRWCADEGLVSDLSGALALPRVPQVIQRTIMLEEVELLLAACHEDEDAVSCRRSEAIVSLLFDSMVRASELVGLRVADVDLERRKLVVVDGKRRDQRIATFSEVTASHLTSWLEVRPETKRSRGALFVNLSAIRLGEPLGKTGLRDLLTGLAERARVPHLTAHAFRRGGACELIRQGFSTRGVMAKGGWSTLQQVECYTRALQLEILFPDANPMNGVTRRNGDDGD